MIELKKILCCLLSPSILIASQATFDSYFNSANDKFRQGNTPSAIEDYKKTIELNPQCHQAFLNLGLAYAQIQKWDESIEVLEKAIKLDPNYAKAYLHLGISYNQKDKHEKAISHLKKALEFNPTSHDALINLARALCASSLFDESINIYNKALEHHPKDTALLLELGNTLNMNNQTEQALNIYYTLIEIIPGNASVLYNIAYTLKKLGRIDEAFPIYKKVLELDPNHAEAHFSLGLAYLAQGDFDHGWPEYEWRWKRGQQSPRDLSKPQWDGRDLHGKTLLIHAEQGLGDTFQFIRYAQIAKEKGAKVVAAVQPQLIKFLSMCPYLDTVSSLFEGLPAHDYQIAMLSIPYVLKTNINTVPAKIPYLYADQKLVVHWKEKLSHDKNFKIGICWQGNSGYSTHFLRTTVAAKSIKLSKLMPLLTLENVTVYNLQKVTGEDQLKNLPENINLVNFDADFDNINGRFMDTAAVIKNLDLMITVDTSMAHLAAGLGCPTWVMMPEPSDWRWMLHRSDTPWYPNMLIFRQKISGDWDIVIQTIVDELKKSMLDKQQISCNQIAREESLNKVDVTIAQLQDALYEKELSKTIDQEYKELACQMYKLIEQRNTIKRSK